MKKLFSIALISGLLLLNPMRTKADLNYCDGQLHRVEATAYCATGNLTATGTVPRANRTVAFAPEYYGCAMYVYTVNADGSLHFAGIYQVEDTGSEPIEKGQRIDLFMASEEECWDFGFQEVLIQVVNGKG